MGKFKTTMWGIRTVDDMGREELLMYTDKQPTLAGTRIEARNYCQRLRTRTAHIKKATVVKLIIQEAN